MKHNIFDPTDSNDDDDADTSFYLGLFMWPKSVPCWKEETRLTDTPPPPRRPSPPPPPAAAASASSSSIVLTRRRGREDSSCGLRLR